MKPIRPPTRSDFPEATGIIVWVVICLIVWIGLVVYWSAA